MKITAREYIKDMQEMWVKGFQKGYEKGCTERDDQQHLNYRLDEIWDSIGNLRENREIASDGVKTREGETSDDND